ncbi:shikimate kinase [Ferrimicrobium sp.]|uniref:shikimate kinase n=1 Tax=Ferrimicrobium sp. TaxID=2926050 RepID=UPI002626904B|nr:shikimate kinase [Ferrimicrobium sp.]
MDLSHPQGSEYERIVAQLAHTLRRERSLRGLSRSDLACRAQLSERYLAQVETGRANPSLTVLTRLAQALDLGLIELIDVAALATPTQAESLIEKLKERVVSERRGIALIGLRGAGKTTLGHLLAAQLGWPFYRLTELITERTQMPLDELFSLGGDAAFRRLELETLQQLVEDSKGQIVVEIGGGLVTNQPAYRLLRRHWTTVWLSTTPEEHMQRVIAQGDLRPMHGSDRAMEELRTILYERTPFYQAAELHLSTSQRSVETSLAELEGLIAKYLSVGDRPEADEPPQEVNG